MLEGKAIVQLLIAPLSLDILQSESAGVKDTGLAPWESLE
jgi:hypothetical protein